MTTPALSVSVHDAFDLRGAVEYDVEVSTGDYTYTGSVVMLPGLPPRVTLANRHGDTVALTPEQAEEIVEQAVKNAGDEHACDDADPTGRKRPVIARRHPMSKHTPEPWRSIGCATYQGQWPGRLTLATWDCPENAERASNCINACSGMTDPAREIEAMRNVIRVAQAYLDPEGIQPSHEAIKEWRNRARAALAQKGA